VNLREHRKRLNKLKEGTHAEIHTESLAANIDFLVLRRFCSRTMGGPSNAQKKNTFEAITAEAASALQEEINKQDAAWRN